LFLEEEERKEKGGKKARFWRNETLRIGSLCHLGGGGEGGVVWGGGKSKKCLDNPRAIPWNLEVELASDPTNPRVEAEL